ncbi:MAG: hypothetical protein ACOZAO_05565 [Patescibacteria group bacterium]
MRALNVEVGEPFFSLDGELLLPESVVQELFGLKHNEKAISQGGIYISRGYKWKSGFTFLFNPTLYFSREQLNNPVFPDYYRDALLKRLIKQGLLQESVDFNSFTSYFEEVTDAKFGYRAFKLVLNKQTLLSTVKRKGFTWGFRLLIKVKSLFKM